MVAQLGPKWRKIGDEIVRSARALACSSMPCGLLHGDFTPWNSKLRTGELCLFNWEWAEEEAPLDWDPFHFQVQTASCLSQKLIVPNGKYNSIACYSLLAQFRNALRRGRPKGEASY